MCFSSALVALVFLLVGVAGPLYAAIFDEQLADRGHITRHKPVPVGWTSTVSWHDELTAADHQLSASGSVPAPPPVKRGVV